MEKLNSYMGMAKNDYAYAKVAMSAGEEIGNYNVVAFLFAQSGEKFLKAIVERCFCDTDAITLLRTHNLRAIYDKIVERYALSVTSKDCKWLGDLYYDACYPGDNFVLANREDALECERIVQVLCDDAERILSEEEKLRDEV